MLCSVFFLSVSFPSFDTSTRQCILEDHPSNGVLGGNDCSTSQAPHHRLVSCASLSFSVSSCASGMERKFRQRVGKEIQTAIKHRLIPRRTCLAVFGYILLLSEFPFQPAGAGQRSFLCIRSCAAGQLAGKRDIA